LELFLPLIRVGKASLRGFGPAAALLIAVSGVIACNPAEPTPSLNPQAIELVGVIRQTAVDTTNTRYELEDGRIWERPTDQFRVVYDHGGIGDLLVVGNDDQGEYVVVAGGIEGLPPECRWVIGPDGLDRGTSVETIGLLWQKGPAFAPSANAGAIGDAFPSRTRFCLDDQARVTTTTIPS
jgi:hypothetical protein